MQTNNDKYFMELALDEARACTETGDVPVGCVIVKDGEVIARGRNTREAEMSATGHAEVNAINEACRKVGHWRLSGCTMYVTLEPCTMCSGAIVSARIDRVVIGAKDPKAGALGSVINVNSYPLNHKPAVEYGVCGMECSSVLTEFFSRRREENKQKKKQNNII